MSNTISGSNAIWGLSGNSTDFEGVLTKLKQVESIPLNNLESWKSDWELRYSAFGEIIDQVSAAKNMLATLANKNSFVSKNVASSDSAVITAVANAAADDVQHTITVSQMASNAIWANTGHVFSSKTDLINDTGETQVFSCTYGGKEYSLNVPQNTTLDSFMSMVNSDASNPGIKVSVVQTGGGYVFQIAGKDTGEANDLVIHNSGLVGMNATGTSSAWRTNSAVDMAATVTNPTSYAYDILMEDGGRFTATIKGDKTNADLARAINAQVGRTIAGIDDGGNLTLNDVKALYRRDTAVDEAFSWPSATLDLGGGTSLDATIADDLDVRLTVNDGMTSSVRTLTIAAGTTRKDAAWAIAQAAGATSAEMSLNTSGSWQLKLDGVTDITLGSTDSGIGVTYDQGSMGTLVTGTGGAQSATATTKVTFDTDKLADMLGGSDADPEKTYTYSLVRTDGGVESFSLAQNATYQDLMAALEARGATVTDGVAKMDGVASFHLSSGRNGGMDGVTVKVDTVTTITGMGSDDPLEAPPSLDYSIVANDTGESLTFSLAGGSSMAEIAKAMQEATRGHGITVSLEDDQGNVREITDDMRVEDIAALGGGWTLSLSNISSLHGPGVTGQIASSDNWSIQRSANARYMIDNWPVEMESASNSVSDAIEGVVFSIQGTGQSSITVSTDIASVETSIQNFLDSVNSVLMVVRDLTKYDEDKEITTNDPEKRGSSNYSTSQLTTEKGGLLMGNYGVQLFKSRFQSVLNSAPSGFTSRTDASDVLSGDLLANLANMGIKIDTDQTSQTYGLLMVAPSSSIGSLQQLDQSNYEDMINNHLSDVVDFFCTSGTGSSTSPDFRYGSHVAGITKAGTYDVSYSVDADGNIAHVYVGGVEATRDTSKPGYYYSVGTGEARGLSLQIDNLAEGDHSGQIRIKEGLVQTVSSFLTAELKFTDVSVSNEQGQADAAISLKSENGALMVLRDNYKTIITNIEKKITKEQTRLSQWETRQRKYFANLETLLEQYSNQQTSLESQLKQLGGNNS